MSTKPLLCAWSCDDHLQACELFIHALRTRSLTDDELLDIVFYQQKAALSCALYPEHELADLALNASELLSALIDGVSRRSVSVTL